ncbi:MAG: PEP-CTERM sorting domain-containing protein, partial [Armatimonadota bacterium]
TQIGSNNYAEWKVADIKINSLTNDYYAVDMLRLGGDASWAQSYFDDVAFTNLQVVPEPGTMVALGSGLVGLVGFAICRRK